MTSQTISAKALISEAEAIERAAREALPAYTILGTVAKYDAAIAAATKLRRAAAIKNTADRRHFLAA